MRLVLIPLIALALLPSALSAMDVYRIDPVHSEVAFKIRHMGLSKVSGRFTKLQGVIWVDEKQPSRSSVEVTIEAASINTDSEARDKHLRGADFFDVEKLPTLTFKSVAVKEVGKGKVEVTGDFTMHGVTRRITIPMTSLGTVKTPSNEVRAGFEGSLSLNRSDYGIKAYPGLIGEEVSITLGVEAVKEEKK